MVHGRHRSVVDTASPSHLQPASVSYSSWLPTRPLPRELQPATASFSIGHLTPCFALPKNSLILTSKPADNQHEEILMCGFSLAAIGSAR